MKLNEHVTDIDSVIDIKLVNEPEYEHVHVNDIETENVYIIGHVNDTAHVTVSETGRVHDIEERTRKRKPHSQT